MGHDLRRVCLLIEVIETPHKEEGVDSQHTRPTRPAKTSCEREQQTCASGGRVRLDRKGMVRAMIN